jgi:hypothetical protein
MQRKYNLIYSELVEDEYDIVGAIAYSLYKQQKVEYISKFKEDYGTEPTDADLEIFHKISTLENSTISYKHRAQSALGTLLSITLEEERTNIEEQLKKNQEDTLLSIIDPLKPPSNWKTYGHGILQSMLGAFLFSLLIAAIILIAQFNSMGMVQTIESAFNVNITSNNPVAISTETAPTVEDSALANKRNEVIK